MIVCFSVSHKTTSLPMLESLNIANPDEFTKTMYEKMAAQECVLLQTCHRVELFCLFKDADKTHAINQALKLWSTETGISLDIIDKAVQIFRGKDAIEHLFFLTSGLESIVLGEDQILGQVRTSWLRAKTEGLTGLIFDKMFNKAINIGRRVRTETGINEGSLSISSAAVDLARQEIGDLTSKKALIIGAGDAGSLAAETLRGKAAVAILVANRTYEQSLLLAQKVSGTAIQFENLLSTIPQMDLVIAAVTVTQPLLREEQIAPIIANLGYSKQLLIIDISQPRAIEEKVGSIQGIRLKTIEDLKEAVAQNMKKRQGEAEKSKTIISEELERFEAELSKLVAQPIITEICHKYEEIRKKELLRMLRKIRESDEKKLMIIDRFSRELTERIAQIPIEQLRAAALKNDGEVLAVAEKLFQSRTAKQGNFIV
jgi:glutamyl-tRNA reductase